MDVIAALRRRVGHRGVSLLFFAQLDLVYGSLLIFATPAPGSVLAYLDTRWPPLHLWGCAWVAVGVICAVYAFLHHDAPAFVAAMSIKFAWGAVNFWAWVDSGNVWSLASTVIWVTAIGWVANAASWEEPMPREGPL